MTWNCLECKEPINTKKETSVGCGLCGKWAHQVCSKLKDAEVTALNKKVGLRWFCTHCEELESTIHKKLNEVYVIVADNKKRIGEVDEKVDKVNEKVDAVDRKAEAALDKVDKVADRATTMVDIVDKMDDKVTKVDEKVDRFEAMVKKLEEKVENNKKEDIIAESRASVFLEIRERENRKENIVLHGIKEPGATVTRGGDRKNFDIGSALEIFEYIGCKLKPDDVRFCFRAGEKSKSADDNPRPLIIGLLDIKHRENILANSRKLGEKDSRFYKVSIIPDLTPIQRKEESDLRAEAEKKNSLMTAEEASNYEWVLVGQRGKRKIIKRQKMFQGHNHVQTASQQEGTRKRVCPAESETVSPPSTRPHQKQRY